MQKRGKTCTCASSGFGYLRDRKLRTKQKMSDHIDKRPRFLLVFKWRITKHAKHKNRIQNYWNPARVTQHKRVQRGKGRNRRPDFRFKTCFKNKCLIACKTFKSYTIPFCFSDFCHSRAPLLDDKG